MTQKTNQTFQDPFLAVVVSRTRVQNRVRSFRARRSRISCVISSQIDPNRTVSAGRVEIGAFRTYPEVSGLSLVRSPPFRPLSRLFPVEQGYTPPNASASEYQSIPVDKIEDFGVHANSYYPIEVSHFKSSHDAKLLDLLWNKYWVMTLSQSPLVSVRGLGWGGTRRNRQTT